MNATQGPLGPADYSATPRFAGPPTFGLLPRLDEVQAARPGAPIDVKIIGVPFDSGVSYRPGARFGPDHIRQSSKLLRPYNQATGSAPFTEQRSEEHTSELQSRGHLVCRLLLE